MKRIGITLRTCNASQYHEPRDGLARDWYTFFNQLNGNHNWLLLPSLGKETVAYFQQWELAGLILSGGDSIGDDSLRDETELALLAHCIKHKLPVLGICRGAQLIHHYFSGKLTQADPTIHIAKRHAIKITSALPWGNNILHQVNSYHGLSLAAPLPKELIGFAYCQQECEGIRHKELPIVGIMWHPERDDRVSEFDRQLFNWLFS